MKCVVCGVESENRYCPGCGKVMADLVNVVGEERWSKIDDCAYIYPSVLRVAKRGTYCERHYPVSGRRGLIVVPAVL
jgi:ribosomal protein S27AE